MRLLLVQHGRALTKEQDPERPLSQAGRDEAENMAAAAKQAGIKVDKIYHSGKLRAQQTAQIFSPCVTPQNAISVIEGMLPNDDVVTFYHNLPAENNLMLVGHLPFLERLATYLLTEQIEPGIIKFQNAGIICIEQMQEKTNWVVNWMLMPRVD